MADTNELIEVCTDLIRIVEGVGCKDWRDQHGQRIKDTNEWVRAYVAINNARAESRKPKATPPADAALTDGINEFLTRVQNYATEDAVREFPMTAIAHINGLIGIIRKQAAALRARPQAVAEGLRYAQALVDVMDGTKDYEIQADTGLPDEDCKRIADARRDAKAMLAASQSATGGACPDCNGDGQYFYGETDSPVAVQCERCLGTGSLSASQSADVKAGG